MSVLLIAIAVAGAPGPADAVHEGEVPQAQAEAFIARCGPRKFETEVISDNQGKVRKAKILLCAKPGESDEQWIATLEKAATQIEGSPALSAAAKSKVTEEIQAAIALVRGETGAHTQAGVTSGSPSSPAITLPSPRPLAEPQPIVATVRPLPPPPAPGRIAAMRAPVSKPPLSVSCSQAGDPAGPGECIELTSDTVLVIRADGDVTSKVSLRFDRDGDPRGGIALGLMRRGQVVRVRLPARVCAGVVRGRVKLQMTVTDPHGNTEQVADTQGPLLLRC
jgi:hypothetical protein